MLRHSGLLHDHISNAYGKNGTEYRRKENDFDSGPTATVETACPWRSYLARPANNKGPTRKDKQTADWKQAHLQISTKAFKFSPTVGSVTADWQQLGANLLPLGSSAPHRIMSLRWRHALDTISRSRIAASGGIGSRRGHHPASEPCRCK